MNLPRARAGRTPMSSSVLTADDEPEPELGVGGGGEPLIVGGMTRCIGGSVWMGGTPGGAEAWAAIPTGDIEGGVGAAGVTCTEADAEAAGEVDGAGGTVAPELGRRCGSLAISPSSSRTVCGRWFGSFASTRASSWSSSSGRFGFKPTADGIDEFTVEYATSIRLAPTYGSRPVSISNVSAPIA